MYYIKVKEQIITCNTLENLCKEIFWLVKNKKDMNYLEICINTNELGEI